MSLIDYLKINKQPNGYVIQEVSPYFRTPAPLLLSYN